MARFTRWLVLPLLIGACSDDSACSGLDRYDPGRAEADADTARAGGDLRLLGVYSYNSLVPGLGPHGVATSASPRPVRMIESTSDAPRSFACRQLNLRARDYAERYNRRMLAIETEDARR